MIIKVTAGGTCPICVRTRRMVSAVVAGALNEIVAYLSDKDIESAHTHIAALLRVLDEIPRSTAALIGDKSIADLREIVERAFAEIKNGETHAADAVLRCGLSAWRDTYPPYQA